MRRYIRSINRRFLLRYRFEYAVALVLIYTVRSMSPAFAWRAARRLARFSFRLGFRRNTILSNLEVAFPEMSAKERRALGFRAWEHSLSMAVDIILQRRMLNRANLFDKIQITGWSQAFIEEYGIEAMPERIQRCLFCAGHFGNWELATGMFKLMGVSIAPVFTAPHNPYIANLIKRVRLDSQARFIERRGAVQAMIEILDQRGNVGFLFDQEAGSGLMVPLFGVEAPTHKTPAVIHRDLGVPLFFGSMIRRGDFLHYEARGALLENPPKTDDRMADLRAIITDLNRRLEERIREYPEQYFWMHRRWKRLGIHGAHYKKESAS
ncbi:MAG: lysophospholipid acyltransferase family protein [Planctomycetota bacterium]|jgi:KDO2-lipid IV(A) lauroyltransferase